MKVVLGALVATLLLAAPVEARDWFVRPGADDGEGSKEKPFRDPFLARNACSAGDTIHVARGVYSGWLGRGSLTIDVPDLTLLGGYDDAFAERDPWKNPTELRSTRDVDSQGRLVTGQAVAVGFVLDGFVLNGAPGNPYSPTGDLVREGSFSPLVELDCQGATIRNCVFLNGSDRALALRGAGFVVENNVFCNFAATPMVELRPAVGATGKKSRLRGNTFVFAWHASFGEEGGVGAALFVAGPAEISRNVFLGATHAIDVTGKNDETSIDENVFWLNGASCVRCLVAGKKLLIGEGTLGDLGDVGFASAQGNDAVDPELALDPKWLGRWVAHVASQDSRVKPATWDKLKAACGGTPTAGWCHAYDPSLGVTLAPKTLARGARPAKLEVKLAPPPTPEPAKEYAPLAWSDLAKDPKKYVGQRVAVRGRVGQGHNHYPWKGTSEAQHAPYSFHDVTGRGADTRGIAVFAPRHGPLARTLDGMTFGSGTSCSMDLWVLRGTVLYADDVSAGCKGALLVEAVALSESTKKPPARPSGRDWFVRAGSSGDGSREKPFGDPQKAIDQAEAGDTIRVAEGEYAGKLRCGYFTVECRWITLEGGYDAEWKERDPWKRPTLLGWKKDERAFVAGPFVRPASGHDGLVLDGFVFDGSAVNSYTPSGDLQLGVGSSPPLLDLASDFVTVRNCFFVNAGRIAVRVAGAGPVVENNVFLNSEYTALEVGHGASWLIEHEATVRDNTFAFTWSEGKSVGQREINDGKALHVGHEWSRVEGNLFAFSDSYGARVVAEGRYVTFTGNEFFANNAGDFFGTVRRDGDDLAKRVSSDAGYRRFEANRGGIDPLLALDAKWFDRYVTRCQSQSGFGRASFADWKKVRERNELPPGPADVTSAKSVQAPPIDWHAALTLVPRNPESKAGARPRKLVVAFAPPPPPTPARSYDAVDLAKVLGEAPARDGAAIELVVFVRASRDAPRLLPEIDERWSAVTIGPTAERSESDAAIAFYKRDTRLERALARLVGKKVRLKGLARKSTDDRTRGVVIVEAVEAAE